MISELVAAYRSGESTNSLCIRFGISKGGVLKLLADHGVTIRQQPMNKSVTRPDRAPPRRRGHNEVMPANRIPYERYFEVSAMPARACLCIRTPTCGA